MEATDSPRRRADAERSIAAIIAAALESLVDQPQLNMAAIARAAGVGRVTLYSHFPTRVALLEAVLDHAIGQAGALFDSAALDRDPADQALRRLIRTSWQVLDRHRRLYQVAQRELGTRQLRRQHAQALTHVEKLLARGRADGVFRTDLPLHWLVTTFYSLLHTAADEVNAGRLRPAQAADVLQATLLPTFTTR